jgi:hypothetical protein
VEIVYGSSAATCPVRAVRAWLAKSVITSGAVFSPADRHGRIGAARLSERAVALVVKRHALGLGLFGGGRLHGSTSVEGLASPVPGKVAGGGRKTFSSASNRNVRTHSVTKPSPAWAVRSMTTNREQT